MLARFFKGRFDRPAHHHPFNELRGSGVEFGRGENFVEQFPCGRARDDVKNFDRRFARRVPQCSARKQQQLFLLAPVPTDFRFFPSRVAAIGPLLEPALPSAFVGRWAALTIGAQRGFVIQAGVGSAGASPKPGSACPRKPTPV